jgi:hypothetical protein
MMCFSRLYLQLEHQVAYGTETAERQSFLVPSWLSMTGGDCVAPQLMSLPLIVNNKTMKLVLPPENVTLGDCGIFAAEPSDKPAAFKVGRIGSEQ